MQVIVTRRRQKGTMEKILGMFKRKRLTLEVGFPDGVEPEIVDRALWNEFGTRTIPERPFMRNTIAQNHKKWARFLRAQAPAILRGRSTEELALLRLGPLAVGDMQEEITRLDTPPNAPSTIAGKGSSNPLIDTGEMRMAVTYHISRQR